MGSGMAEEKCRWSLSMLFGEGLHAGTVGVGMCLAHTVCVSPLSASD